MLQTLLLLAFALALPGLASAGNDITRYTCGGLHFTRTDGVGGLEIGTTAYSVRNLDTSEPVTWQRLTIRNLVGQTVHDSGPSTGTPLPLNLDIPGGLDVTSVPPGASYYLSTNHIFGNAAIPGAAGQGNALTAVIEVAIKHGKLVEVAQSIRERQLFTPVGAAPFQGQTRTRDGRLCEPLGN